MIDDPFILVDPPEPLPAGLGVVMLRSRLGTLKGMQERNLQGRFLVRALLSDHVPLSGSVRQILSRPVQHSLFVQGNPLTMYLHHGGRNAVFFDLLPEAADKLKSIEVEVETKFPSNAFLAARTAFNCLLDSVMRVRWLPITISRLDLHIAGEVEPLCHQLVLPFDESLRIGPLGGIHQFPPIAAYEAVVREAITATSPFYRLLCAYRLYEGLQPLRRWLRDTAAKLQIDTRLPKPREVDPRELMLYGFSEEFRSGLRTTDDVWKKMTEHRNSVAHFLSRKSGAALRIFEGATYYEYSLCGAYLLKCANEGFRDLWQYFSKHLNSHLTRGSILPLAEQREMFILRPDKT